MLRELDAGTNAFTRSTKGKRSIANRPQSVYGRLRATRPDEYVLMDTTRLDVFALDPVTLRWMQAETFACARLVTDRVRCAGEAEILVDGALRQLWRAGR